MSPTFALLLWFVLLSGLLLWDWAARPETTSFWTWVPVLWIFISASRLPSQWLGGEVVRSADAFENGNPLDRSVLSFLILTAVVILLSRPFDWGRFAVSNIALLALVSYTLLSFTWSDFPLVALKRWVRDLGSCLVILVALSDKRPFDAVQTVLRRLTYLLIPLSILINRYFPEIGKEYDPWTGVGYYVGCTTSKNMLGVACLISGVFFFWDITTRWPARKQRRTRLILTVNIVFFAMTLYLLHIAKSATSEVCLTIACVMIVAAHSKFFQRRRSFLIGIAPLCFGLYLILAFGLGLNGELAGAVGRDPTLTDRTKIWNIVLAMQTNPLLGAGYESFWLGPRLRWFWENSGLGRLNEAHNGYLEVYLNLGVMGLLFLGSFLVATYRNICRAIKGPTSTASLALAVWTVMLFYSMTEAGFRSGVLWLTFLLVCLPLGGNVNARVPGSVSHKTRVPSATGGLVLTEG